MEREDWLERTRYMEIEYEETPGQRPINEYRDRPILPSANEVIKGEKRAGASNRQS